MSIGNFVTLNPYYVTHCEPFIAAYEVSADIIQPKIIKHHQHATISSTATSTNSTS